VADSVARWNGFDRDTNYVSATKLEVSILASDLAQQGTYELSVHSPAPGGGTSQMATFTVAPPPNPAPVTTALSPGSRAAESTAFTLTVQGSDFSETSVVRWNGKDRPTTFVSSSKLTANIPASDIAVPGSASISVFTPAPGGGTSAELTFAITNPKPAITSVTQQSLVAGDNAGGREVVIRGKGFLPATTIRIGMVTRTATYISPTEVRFYLTAEEVATPRMLQIRVANPSPGGGTSLSWWLWVD
jgi:hypothetical protein